LPDDEECVRVIKSLCTPVDFREGGEDEWANLGSVNDGRVIVE
jgi:hypothetical protein